MKQFRRSVGMAAGIALAVLLAAFFMGSGAVAGTSGSENKIIQLMILHRSNLVEKNTGGGQKVINADNNTVTVMNNDRTCIVDAKNCLIIIADKGGVVVTENGDKTEVTVVNGNADVVVKDGQKEPVDWEAGFTTGIVRPIPLTQTYRSYNPDAGRDGFTSDSTASGKTGSNMIIRKTTGGAEIIYGGPEEAKKQLQNAVKNTPSDGTNLAMANATNIYRKDDSWTWTDEVFITAGSESKPYDGRTMKNNTFTSKNLPEDFTLTAECSGSILNVGKENNAIIEYHIYNRKNEDVTAHFTNVKKYKGTLQVEPATLKVVTESAEKEYDGTPLTNTNASIEGLVNGETATVAGTGSITYPGNVDNSYEITWGTAVNTNYEVETVSSGVLTVHKSTKDISITAGSAEKNYDGKDLTCLEATASGLPEGFSVKIGSTSAIRNAGSCDNEISEYHILDRSGKDVTSCFTKVSTAKGTLTVRPAEVTVTSGSAEKEYDGTALTCSEFTASGLAEGESISLTFTESQTDVGSTENAFGIEWGNTEAGNYTVKTVSGTLTVKQNSSAITVTAGSKNAEYSGKELTCGEFTAEGLPAGLTATAVVSGGQTEPGSSSNTIRSVGIKDGAGKDVTSFFSGIVTKEGTLTVGNNTSQITVETSSGSKVYDGTELTVTGTKVSGLPEGFTLNATGYPAITNAGEAENKPTGISILNGAQKDVTSFFSNITVKAGKLTVEKAAARVTTDSASKVYDGKALTCTVGSITLVGNETATVTGTGTITEVGKVTNTARIDWGKTNKDNYTVTENPGTLEVTPYTERVVITSGSAAKAYDGTPLTCTGCSANGLPSGFTAEVTCTASRTDAGESDNIITSYVIRDGSGKDVTSCFGNISTVSGILTVNKAAVTVSAGSATKTYDGTALTSAETTVAGLVSGESITVTNTGSITDAGTAENVPAVTWSGAKEGNYTLNLVNGTLTVNKAAVTVTAGSATKTYDGTALTSTEATVAGLAGGDSITVTNTGSITDAGTAENVPAVTWSGAKEGNYTLSLVNGTLTVNKAAVTVTAGSATKTYDGTALTSTEATVAGLAGGESITVTNTGSITDAGRAENVPAVTWSGAREGNYTVNLVNGTLTVTKRALTIETGSATKSYDGTALTCTDVNVSGFVDGEGASITTTGSLVGNATETTTAPNTYQISWDGAKESNYSITEKIGTLTVTPQEAIAPAGG